MKQHYPQCIGQERRIASGKTSNQDSSIKGPSSKAKEVLSRK
jgi:hypothetical protein